MNIICGKGIFWSWETYYTALQTNLFDSGLLSYEQIISLKNMNLIWISEWRSFACGLVINLNCSAPSLFLKNILKHVCEMLTQIFIDAGDENLRIYCSSYLPLNHKIYNMYRRKPHSWIFYYFKISRQNVLNWSNDTLVFFCVQFILYFILIFII